MCLSMTAATNLLVGIGVAALLASAGYIVHGYIHEQGRLAERAVWERKAQDWETEVLRLKSRYQAKEGEYQQTIFGLTTTLYESEQLHAQVLSGLTAAHAQRLQHAAERAAVYQRQAAGSAADAQALAEHAARLDASIEEGRVVVTELAATVRLRDEQVKALGAVILADRQLFSDLEATDEP